MLGLKDYPIAFHEVVRAKGIVSQYLTPTPLILSHGLSQLLQAEVHVKHENHHPTGSFKIRGGVNLLHHLHQAGVKGVVTFSTGNHGLSIAQAASWLGLQATVVVPERNNPVKNRGIRALGARLVEAGETFEEASRKVDEIVRKEGYYDAHPADEPLLINGVGTEFLEVIEKLPDMDAVIVPVGAGSEAAAAAVVLKTINPKVEIFAVQAKASPAGCDSWRAGRLLQAGNQTFAGGFATGTAYETPFALYKDHLSDFVLLSEEELYEGIALAAHYTHSYLEGAGASTIMAAVKLQKRLQGKKVVLQFSGGNPSPDEIRRAYGLEAFVTGREKA